MLCMVRLVWCRRLSNPSDSGSSQMVDRVDGRNVGMLEILRFQT